jgi:hypothetical protein
MMLSSFCYADEVKNQESMADKLAAARFTGEVKKVAILLDAPMTYADNENIRKLVPEKATSIFKKPKFQILPFDDAQMQKKIYREEHNMVTSDYRTISALKMADVQSLGKQLGADYVLFLNVHNTMPRLGVGFFSMSFKTTITCDMRLMNVVDGKYTFMKQIVRDGSSTAVMYGIPSFDGAYRDALSKSLAELNTIDTSNL